MSHIWIPALRGIRALLTSTVAGILVFSPAISSAATVDDATDLVDLSLEELLNMEITTLSRKAEDSPKHQLSVRSSMDFASDWRLDLWVRYVDKLESQGIDSYTALDLRMARQVTDALEVSAVGRNLFAGDHLEFVSELGD